MFTIRVNRKETFKKVKPVPLGPMPKPLNKVITPDIAESPLQLIKEISVIEHGRNFQKVMEETLGLSPEFCRASYERTLQVDIESGEPVVGHDVKCGHREVTLVQPIVLYAVFETVDRKARFICVGCTNKTVYMIVKKELAYSFVIDMSSLTVKEAVKNLYLSNLNKGARVYRKTAQLLPNFFNTLFDAAYPERTLLEFTLTHISGVGLPVRLYHHPHQPTLNMLSVNGWVYDVDLNEFPGTQISRGYNQRKPK